MHNTKDIGFLIPNLTNNTFCDNLLDTIKKFINNNPYDQTVIFNSSCDKIDTKNIPILHLSHSQFFYGKLFLFDLASVVLSQKFPNISKRYLYAQDIPWMNSPQTNYKYWLDIYNQNNLELIVPTENLCNIYEIAWKKPIGIVENFNYEQIKKIIR